MADRKDKINEQQAEQEIREEIREEIEARRPGACSGAVFSER